MTRDAMDLTARLQAGDPARGAALDGAEVARLRRRLADAAAEPEPAPWPWRAVWGGAALTALALVLAMRAPEAPAAAPGAARAEDQQLQFETADGVRIVWVLSPNVPL